MRILGIDPGLQTTGFGVVDVDGHRLSYVASGTIRTTTLALGDLPGRLKILFDGITEVAARYEPDVASVEIVFVNVNPQSTLLLGQARGAAITALVASNLPVAEYTALQMKKAVVGHGRAAKSQVQEMVRRLLQLPGLPGTDAADGLGMAITHAHAGAAMGRLGEAATLNRRQHAMYKGGGATDTGDQRAEGGRRKAGHAPALPMSPASLHPPGKKIPRPKTRYSPPGLSAVAQAYAICVFIRSARSLGDGWVDRKLLESPPDIAASFSSAVTQALPS